MSLAPVLFLALSALFPQQLAPRAPAISEARVREVVADRSVALQSCYQDGLDRDAKLKGAVGVEMDVGESGLVLDAKSTKATTIGDAEVVACVVKVMRSLDFGKQDAPSTVRYAVQFEPDPPAKKDE